MTSSATKPSPAALPTLATRPPRKSQKRTQETRDKIIDAAIPEFARRGFEGASTRAIAAAAGVQHTLVTYHFGCKEGLWQASLNKMGEVRSQRFDSRLDGLRGVDDSTTLYLFLEEFIRYSAEVPDYAWFLSHVASHQTPQLEWVLKNYIIDGFERVGQLIRSAQKAGHFVEGDPKYLYYLFIGMATRIFMLSAEVEEILGVSPFDPAFVDQHVKSCLSLFFKGEPTRWRAAS
jgi:AcrR family transcriptional regulator